MPASPEKLTEIQAHPLFQQLLPRQQSFVTHFLNTDDRVGSIRAAGYKPGTDVTADMMGRRLLKHSIIKQLVAAALGYADMGGMLSKKELLLRMSEHIRVTQNTTLFWQLIVMYSQMQGWIKDKSEVPDVQEVVRKMEQYRKTNREGNKRRAEQK